MPAATGARRLSTFLTDLPTIGEPDVHDALAIFPLLGPPPALDYLSFAQARAQGVLILELEQGASVRNLLVDNPLDIPVLLFDGEEVIGAQQNRTFDTSVLVPPHTRLSVPVSCVEAGRWDASRHHESFEPAPQTAYPSLRRMKGEHVRAQRERHAEPRADQASVWAEVSARSSRYGVRSRTSAMSDLFDDRRERLVEIYAAMSLRPGQAGALVAIGGDFAVLDRISRPEVLESLYGPLVQGYALDALDVPSRDPPSLDDARAMLERVLACRVTEYDGIGLGRDAHVAEGAIAGAGVLAGDELVALSVFMTEPAGDAPTARSGRIRRPSRRRA
jgi:hypothetical protein